MKRLEEQVTCEDDTGKRYEVEVYRNLEREADDSQTIGVREAYLAGNLDSPLKVYDDENTFQTREGKTLRRVTGVSGSDVKGAGRR
jgi:hypothetical protein